MVRKLPLIAVFLGGLVAVPVVHAGSPEERLVADHAAWSAAREDHQRRLSAGAMDASERRDDMAFLAELQARVARGCAVLRDLERPVPEGIVCPRSADLALPPPLPGSDGIATGARRGESLDAEFDASLGSFDELLLREQDRVRAARPRDEAAEMARAGEGGAAAAATTPGGAGKGEPGVAGTSGPGEMGSAGAEGQAGQPPGREVGTSGASAGGRGEIATDAEGSAAGPGRGRVEPAPADLPNPSGDDVVARQLREAAEQERDPELRARLWEEYRRYRSGT